MKQHLEMLSLGLVLWLASCGTGCGPLPPVEPPRPVPGAGCTDACERMALIDYPGHGGSPGPDRTPGTADDRTCAEVCAEYRELGFGFAWDTECLAGARNTAEADACAESEP